MLTQVIKCKFCNSEPHIPDGPTGHYQICCNNCGIEVIRLTGEEAVSVWNKLMEDLHAITAQPIETKESNGYISPEIGHVSTPNT